MAQRYDYGCGMTMPVRVVAVVKEILSQESSPLASTMGQFMPEETVRDVLTGSG